MKRLLRLTAVMEVPAGLALMAVPAVVVQLLLGSPLDTSGAATLGRGQSCVACIGCRLLAGAR